MKVNLQFPMSAPERWETWVGEHHLTELAVAAEENGFDIVSATDHPFPSQDWLTTGGHHAFDPFVALSFMAAATRRVRLMTFILVAAYRNPYLTAKATASLDILSGGRLVVGMGAGYQREEFDVLGASYNGRGPRFDEAMMVMRRAWQGTVVEHDGPDFPAHGHVMRPTPKQQGGPPIWVGGNSVASRRRVRDGAEGWLPFEQTEAMSVATGTPRLTTDELADAVITLRAQRAERGLPAGFDVCFTPALRGSSPARIERLLTQAPALSDAGVTHVSVELAARSMDDCLREVETMGAMLRSSPLPVTSPSS
jgi:probable F420-dependent oxidoreductase